jgi:hypothetical protein
MMFWSIRFNLIKALLEDFLKFRGFDIIHWLLKLQFLQFLIQLIKFQLIFLSYWILFFLINSEIFFNLINYIIFLIFFTNNIFHKCSYILIGSIFSFHNKLHFIFSITLYLHLLIIFSFHLFQLNQFITLYLFPSFLLNFNNLL